MAKDKVKLTEITQAIQRSTGMNYEDKVPRKVEQYIRLGIDISPLGSSRYCDIIKSGQARNATTATIYTTPTDKDFYLTTALLSVIKDVTSTSTASDIAVTIGGVVVKLIVISEITLTAQTETIPQSYSFPLKIDRGTNIIIENSTNVAEINARGSITGFLFDSSVYQQFGDDTQ